MNYLDWIAKWSSYTPHKLAVSSFLNKQSYTYRHLHEESLKIGSYLQNRCQLKKGDRLAVIAEHSPEYLMLFIATQRLGIILVPLNYRCTSQELLFCIEDVSPKLILTENKFKVVSQELNEELSTEFLLFKSFFKAARSINADHFESNFEIEADQPIFIFYTSGTTGKPKGVIYTNKMMFWNSLNTSVQLEITSEDHTVNALPPYHTSGWNVLLLPMLHRGARVDFLSKFKSEELLKYIQEQPITLFLAIPTMLRMMEKSSLFETFKPNKLKYFIVGGENLSISTIDTWASKGVLIRQGYGLTEAGPSITSLHHHDALWKKGSIGKPNFYVDVKIVDEENEEVGVNTPGELCLRGHIVTPGYWNNSSYTLEKIRNQWFHTGDMVKKDENDFFYILGRKNQTYISGGENIHPSEIEAKLYLMGGILEAAVIGVENENWGETGVTFIVLQDENLSKNEITFHLSQHLASYKIPSDIIFLDSLPKSGLGKINRNELKYIYNKMNYGQENFL